MIESRSYRNAMGNGRFTSFTTGYKETDLWIGVDPGSFCAGMKKFCFESIKKYRLELEKYLLADPGYGKSFVPYQPVYPAPEMIVTMAEAGRKAKVGPMAAVAGAFSERLGHDLIKHFNINELVIENGGDIFLFLDKSLILSVYAGADPLSGKIGLEIPEGMGPLGVCTSSGKIGPSVSFGNADAVMVACKETALADAWATSLCNEVKKSEDIDEILKQAENIPEILSVAVICDGKIGIRGRFDLKIIS